MTKTQLTQQDWIEAAFRALTKNGPQAIKAEAIARDLKISKGSFYWHFKDIKALKSEMLAHWQHVATHAIIAELDSQKQGARETLNQLITIIASDIAEPYGGITAESAIRNWARYDKDARAAMMNVDHQRIDYLTGLFEQCGQNQNTAQNHAHLMYSALIGLRDLPNQNAEKVGQQLSYLLQRFI